MDNWDFKKRFLKKTFYLISYLNYLIYVIWIIQVNPVLSWQILSRSYLLKISFNTVIFDTQMI